MVDSVMTGGRGDFDDLFNFMNSAAFLATFEFKFEAFAFADFPGDVLFDGLVKGGEDVHFHEEMDNLERFEVDAGGEILNDDGGLHVMRLESPGAGVSAAGVGLGSEEEAVRDWTGVSGAESGLGSSRGWWCPG
ncbi:MAG: hypothetical protein HC904_15790 [Blastochloris sp.]|nr:hypothetical protein [Blastochloris sp.]